MSTGTIRKTMYRTLPILGLTVASAFSSPSNTEVETTESSSLNQAFGIPFERQNKCKESFTTAAHIEAFSSLFFKDNNGGYSKHASTAAAILYDRAYQNDRDCTTVTLLDINPFQKKLGLYQAFTENDVVTVSSFIPWNPPPTKEDRPRIRPKSPPIQDPDSPPDDRGPQAQPAPPTLPEFPEPGPIADTINQTLQDIQEQERIAYAARITEQYNRLMDLRLPFTAQAQIDDVFWDTVSDAILVLPATNEGNEKYNAKAVYMSILDQADSVMVVGALEDNNRIASYSTDIAPDFVWYTAFDQGFCFPYYATNEEIINYAEIFNHSDIYQADDKNLESAAAGSNSCSLTGTSYVSPDIGGFMMQAKNHYPDLSAMEITVAAYLATSQNIDSIPVTDFHLNARGLPFDDLEAGHGAFLPDIFFHFLGKLSDFKSDEGITAPEYGRIESKMRKFTPGTTATLHFPESSTAIRTIGSFQFTLPEGTDPALPVEAFPEAITVYSPSGTQYDIPLRLEADLAKIGSVRAGFSISAYLGENIEGEWHVEVPPGYGLVEASLEHITADIYFENSINRIIDYAIEWHGQNNDIIAHMDETPWAADTQVEAADAPAPSEQPRLPVFKLDL